ncbi:diaminopimelate epimerase [bacterium]|nr:diaminopimelate epimerase [bacterium]
MLLEFSKMVGCGNDFVVVNNLKSGFPYEKAKLLCDRKFGIGADGLLVLEKSKNFAYKMRYFNSDGGEVDFCGNGARCLFAFAFKNNFVNKSCFFEAKDGIHFVEMLENSLVRLKMKAVTNKLESFFLFENYVAKINTGVPHIVLWSEKDFSTKEIYELGNKIRFHKMFSPKGINANFVKILSENSIFVRTYERGVEDETLSCGTGVVASAICSKLAGKIQQSRVEVGTLGGKFEVNFDEKLEEIFLTGEVKIVFNGKIEL